MKVVKELIRVLDKSKIKPIEVLDFSNKKQSKYKSYYDTILNNEYIDEAKLSKKFSEDVPSGKKYLMFKSRFRMRLVNYIFFLDFSNRNEYVKHYAKAYRFTLVAKFLLMLGAKQSSYFYSNKAFKNAQKFELYDLLLIINQINISRYSIESKLNALENEIQQMNNNMQTYSLELKIDAIYAKCGVLLSKSVVLNNDNLQKYELLIEGAESYLLSNAHNFKSFWIAKTCVIEYCEYIGDYSNVLKYCEELELMLEKKPQFAFNVRKLILNTWKLEAYGNLNMLHEVEKIINTLDDLVKNNTFNWFHIQRKIFEYYMNTKQYNEAYKVSQKVLGNENFKNYNTRFREIWLLRNAYATLLCVVLNIDNNLIIKDVKIEKILNSVDSMSKDKLGVNLATIVLEIIYQYFNNEVDELIDKYNVLMHYKLRYLKPAGLKRAIVFFNFIIRTSQKGFLKDSLKIESKRALLKLKNLESQNAERRSYEIITYENIIEMMLAKKD